MHPPDARTPSSDEPSEDHPLPTARVGDGQHSVAECAAWVRVTCKSGVAHSCCSASVGLCHASAAMMRTHSAVRCSGGVASGALSACATVSAAHVAAPTTPSGPSGLLPSPPPPLLITPHTRRARSSPPCSKWSISNSDASASRSGAALRCSRASTVGRMGGASVTGAERACEMKDRQYQPACHPAGSAASVHHHR
jgi:hypothetical protein